MALPSQPPPPPPPPGPYEVTPQPTLGRVLGGVIIGALVFALAGALAVACGTWAWALAADNGETNSEAPQWFLIGALAGAILFGPVGAVVGLVQRLTDWSMRRWWLFPVVGATLGVLLVTGGQHSHIAWPFLGLGGGLIAGVLLRALLVDG